MGLSLSPEAYADTLTVTSLANSGPGTLRDQVAAAAPGDTINFSVTGTIELTGSVGLSISKDLTIAGPGAGSLTVMGGNGGGLSTFTINGGIVGISGLTLSNGVGTNTTNAAGQIDLLGGAIYMTGGTVTLTGCTLSNNDATYGGAIYQNGGSLAVTGCTISNNKVDLGGLTGFLNQSSAGGGGIYTKNGFLTVTNSSISGNSSGDQFPDSQPAYGFAGGIFCGEGSTTTITSSTISGNSANNPTDISNNFGGGIFNLGTLTIRNSTISGNMCRCPTIGVGTIYGGGGIFNFGVGVLTVSNSTITGNYGQTGGGIRSYGPLILFNSIVVDNDSRNDGTDIYSDGVTAVSSDYNMVRSSYVFDPATQQNTTLLPGTHNVVLNPNPLHQSAFLAPLANNGGPTQTHRLLADSPAADAGDPNFDTTNMPYDQRGPGSPRVRNGRVCIGAFESEVNQSGSNFIVNTLDDHDDGIAGVSDCTLREAVNYAPAGATITFSMTGTIALTGGEMVLAKNLTFQGPASAPGITLSGNNLSRIFTIHSTVALSNLTLSGGNGVGVTSSGSGGAISIDNGYTLSVANSTFSGNSVTGSSGAIRNAGTLTVTNSTFSGNSAAVAGGAIRSGGTLTVTNSTFSGNSCSGSLGGGGLFSGGTLTLSNNIVAGNTAPAGPDILTIAAASGGDYNLVGDPSGATLAGTHNITGQAANLGALANHGGPTQTFALLAGSPALNAGSNALIPGGVTTDQRGFARVESGTVDIGAFEVDVTPPTIGISAPSSTIANAGSAVNYTVNYSDAGFSSSTLSAGDVTLNRTGTADATVSVDAGSGTTRTVTLGGITGNGTLGISIAAGTATDHDGNTAPAAGPGSPFTVDTTPPSVTINQAAGQTDPTISTPIHFTVVFSKPVTNFTTGSVTLGGTAGATTATVTGSGPTYDVAVTGMTRSGTVIATIPAGVALDAAANGNTVSTSTDNAISYTSPEIVQSSGTIRAAEGGGFDIGFIGNPGLEYTIQFSANLAPGGWQTLRTQVADSSGAISITDNPPAGTARRFYRLLLP
jgi:CSLREA domain-containing protein